MFDITADKTTTLLNKMVDFTAFKHKVIANNIANVNTPGYKRLDVSFNKSMENAINGGDSIRDLSVEVTKTEEEGVESAFRQDENTVNIDKEVSVMMQNSLSYNVYIELMSKKVALIKQAMRSR